MGSANLTGLGAGGMHVEAGILLDSRDDDPDEILDQIAAAINAWFATPARDGFEAVTGGADIDRLVTEGVLVETRPPRPRRARGAAGGGGAARLRRLITLPQPPEPVRGATPVEPAPPVARDDRTLLVTLRDHETARILAARRTREGSGSQYFYLGVDCFDFFPPLTIPGANPNKNSCEVTLYCMDLSTTCHRSQVDHEDNSDVRLYSGIYKFTGRARPGDLAAVSRIGPAEYELRIIPQGTDPYIALEPLANIPIGNRDKHYGYVRNEDFSRVIGQPVPDRGRTTAFRQHFPRRRRT